MLNRIFIVYEELKHLNLNEGLDRNNSTFCWYYCFLL